MLSRPTHVFFLMKIDQAWCICCTHVDDIFVLYNKLGAKFKEKLFQKFSERVEIQNLGHVSWALKTQILRDREAGILKISQEAYISDILDRYSLDKNFPLRETKSSRESPYCVREFSEEENKVDETLKKKFQSQIGALWWLAQISRPDIIFPLHVCSKLINTPSISLGIRLQKIFTYLSASRNFGLIYERPSPKTPLLSAYVDAAFASEEGVASRIGYLYFFQGNLVSWVTENPKRIMTSSTEVECRGLTEVSKENVWHRQLHQELGLFDISNPSVVFEDNHSSILLLENQGTPHKKSKHFGIEWAYVKEAANLKEILVQYVETTVQRADFLTKAISHTKFHEHRDCVMGEREKQDFFLLADSSHKHRENETEIVHSGRFQGGGAIKAS